MKSTAHRANPERTGKGPAAQREALRAGSGEAAREAATAAGTVPLSRSARMVAQRAQIDTTFGRAAQRQEPEDDELQLKTAAPGALQRQGPEDDEDVLQGRFATVQRERGDEDEVLQGRVEPVQRLQAEDDDSLKMKQPSAAGAAGLRNDTGMPDDLKSGIESLSGMAMDHVRVHYNSAQPAQLNALAYAQGSDIHVAPGQERHLPHEAWHVVQQAQGRVQPTMQLKDGVPVNDDAGLEREADVMGAKAVQMRRGLGRDTGAGANTARGVQRTQATREPSQKQRDTSGERGRLGLAITATTSQVRTLQQQASTTHPELRSEDLRPRPHRVGLSYGHVQRWGRADAPTLIQCSPESEAKMKELMTPKTFTLAGEEVAVQDMLAASLNDGLDKATEQADSQIKDLERQSEELQKEWSELNDQYTAAKGDKQTQDELWAQMGSVNEEIGALSNATRRLTSKRDDLAQVTCIGGIVLSEAIGELADLVDKVELIELEPMAGAQKGTLTNALSTSTFDVVEKAGLSSAVVRNTLTTMDKAGQLDYLRKAGLPNETHKIVVEVHYYRSRNTSQTNLHKDTLGETLFVNLNFLNKARMLGPEYIVNPQSSKEHDDFVAKKLPTTFVADLNAAKAAAGEPTEIGATMLDPNGVVTFVDEAIHHKTPTREQREAGVDSLRTALKAAYGGEYEDAEQAYAGYTSAASYSIWTWGSYLKTYEAKARSDKWWTVMDGLAKMGKAKQNRVQLAAWLPAPFDTVIDGVIAESSSNFTQAPLSYEGEGGTRRTSAVKVQPPGRAPLKRQLSLKDVRAEVERITVTGSEGNKRSFFRTWVRAVPR